LAVRIPAACVREAGLRVGDSVELEAVGSDRSPPSETPFDKDAFLLVLDAFHSETPMGDVAQENGATAVATVDTTMAENAKRLGLKLALLGN